MSSGGQSAANFGGLQGMRIRDASDVVTQTKLRLAYVTNNQANSGYSGVNAYRSKGIQNSYNFLLQVQEGLRECGVSTNGATFTSVQGNAINFLPPTGTVVTNNTIPVTLQFP